MKGSSTEVSVVVLSLDHWDHTRVALQSLARTEAVGFETIVVDNGSQDEVVDRLLALQRSPLGVRLRLRCHIVGRNLGVASGRNLGASLAGGRILAFLDNDVEIVDPAWLRWLVEGLGRAPGTGVVGSVLVHPGGDGAIQFCGGSVDARGRVHLETSRPEGCAGGGLVPTTFALGASLATPHDLFDGVGGFDPAFDPMDYEDVDYCLRVAEVGRPSVIAVRSRVVHQGHVTTGGSDFARSRTYLVNGRRFVRRWGDQLPALAVARPDPRSAGA